MVAESCDLVQYQECLKLTFVGSLTDNSETGSGFPASRPESVGGYLQCR